MCGAAASNWPTAPPACPTTPTGWPAPQPNKTTRWPRRRRRWKKSSASIEEIGVMADALSRQADDTRAQTAHGETVVSGLR